MTDTINKKILIVEDDKDFLFILQANLKNEGFSIVTAGDGQEGLDSIEKEKPDLILLDILMPNMGGPEMAKQMKAKGISIPIIFLTNLKDADHINEVEEITMSDYIIKSDTSIKKIIAEVKKRLAIGQSIK